MRLPSPDRPWLRNLAAALAGALLALAFAPVQCWPLAIVCPAALMLLLEGATPRAAAARGFWFNAGTFTAGTYWLYISIHLVASAPAYMALGLMAGLVAIMGLYGALLGYVAARFLPASGALRYLLGLPAAWLLIEWWRGWFLSGFAWLSLGYSQTDTLLAHLAPVLGVYGLSAVLLVAAGALVTLLRGGTRERVAALVLIAAPWPIAASLRGLEWTHASGPPVGVAIVQGAIPEDQKWLDSNKDATLALYRELTRRELGVPLIVWPEAAPPDLAQNIEDYLLELYREARRHGSALVLGVVRTSDDGEQYYNSVLSLGTEVGWYNKSHLVPFAEFFPVPSFVRSWLRLMNLPYSDFTPGARHQPLLAAAGLKLAASIRYEDAFGSMPLANLADTDALVNVTNDAWFGHSSARFQHFQIARMRALETGRYLLRAANDGISAVIGPHGEVLAQAPEYRPAVLRSSITARRGLPPYAHTGNWLIISLSATTLAGVLAGRRMAGRRQLRPAPANVS